MERFVRIIVVGGVALVAGLWVATLFGAWSLPWLVGVVLAFGGVGGLAGGIWEEIEY